MTKSQFSEVQAATVKDCLAWLSANKADMSAEAHALLAEAHDDWFSLLPAGSICGTVANLTAKSAPAPATAAASQTAAKSAPAPAAAPAPVPKPTHPPSLRPAWDTRPLCAPRNKLAGQ